MIRISGQHYMRLFAVSVVVMLLVLQTGCWSRKEIETLAFVMASGVDFAEMPNRIMLTAQIAKPKALAAAAMGGSDLERAVWTVSSTGNTIFEAIRHLARQSSRRAFFAHSQWVILGEDVARAGINNVLDAYERDPESRAGAKLAVVKDGKASDFLQTESELESIGAEAYLGILDDASEALSTVVDVDIHEFFKVMASEGIEPVAVRVEIIDRLPDVDVRGQMEQSCISTAPRISGAAVFKDRMLVGWLDEAETRGYNWVRGRVKGSVLTIEDPKEDGQYMTIAILGADSSIEVEMKDDRPVAKVRIQAEANFGETQHMVGRTEDSNLLAKAIIRRFAEAIRQEVHQAIDKAQEEYGSDIFGFGQAIHRKYPKVWKNLRSNWNDDGFKKLNVTVEVKTKIRQIGLVEINLPESR